MRALRDRAFQTYRDERNKARFSKKREVLLKEEEKRDKELENFLTMDDIIEGEIETKILSTRAKIIRDSIKNQSIKAILDQVTKLNSYLCTDPTLKEERLKKFRKTGLILDYVELIKLSFIKNKNVSWTTVEGIANIKDAYLEEYNLMKSLVWSLSNICAGDESEIDEVYESGYFEVVIQMLEVKCEAILGDVMVTIGNIIGCNYKKYRKLLNSVGFINHFKAFFQENPRILQNKRVIQDIAWVFSNYCMELKEINEDVSLIFNWSCLGVFGLE